MRRLLLIVTIVLTIVLFSGCSQFKAQYDISLTRVERPAEAKERYGEQKISTTQEDGVNKFVFEDEMVKIIWFPKRADFVFNLKNKTNNSIKIIWDEAVYVDASGSSGRVMHTGVKYTDRNASQPPSVIVRNGSMDDLVSPTENVYYVSGQYGGWRTASLFPQTGNSQSELKQKTDIYKGKNVQILLPLEIENVINEYIFVFSINDILISER